MILQVVGGGGVEGVKQVVPHEISSLVRAWSWWGAGDPSSLLGWLSLKCLWPTRVEVSSRYLDVWSRAEGRGLDQNS